MDKYQLIDQLEGKQIMTPDGLWHKVTGGQFVTRYGVVKLINHGVEMLEAFLRTAREEVKDPATIAAINFWAGDSGSIEEMLG